MNSDNQNKTWVQIIGTDKVFEIENFQYSLTLKNLVDDLGNDPNEPIPIPSEPDNNGVTLKNLKKLSNVLKNFPFNYLTKETFDNFVNGNLSEPYDILEIENRIREKYYSQIPYLKTFDDLSVQKIMTFIKLCNFLGVEFIIKFLTELSVVKIKEELKKTNN